MKYILPLLLLFITLPSLAQQVSIKGQVLNQNQKALAGAHLSLQYPWGEEVKSAITNNDGRFSFDSVEKGGYQLLVTFLGHQNAKVEVNVKDQSIQLAAIVLQEGAVDLNEVEVKDKIPLAQQLGDTTQYNADAFKTMKDANAEELVEKMPGVVVEDGKVQAQGEEVKEVLVDGRPFFGNDPRAALRNLPAEVISKIQIFDQKSDQAQFSGFDDGETSKTINIITRPNMRSGQFGKITTGYGHEEKYQVGGNASLFDGNRRTSIIAQSNNVNQQNFATEDLLGVVGSGSRRGRGGFRGGRGRGGGGGGRGGRGGGGSVNDFLVQQQDGIAQTHAFGVNFSDKWGKKFDFSGSYFFNYTDTDAEEAVNRAFIERAGAGEVYEENNTSNSRNINHRFNMRMEYQIDSANSIIMRPRLSFQDNQGWANTFGQTTLSDQLLSQTSNEYRPDLRAWDFNNRFLFRHRFKKRGRTFSFNLTTAYNPKNGESNLLSINSFIANPSTIDSLDQLSSLEVNTWSVATSTSYTEPIGKNSSLLFNFRNSWRADDSEKLTSDFDALDQSYSLLNEQLSNVFNNDYDTQELGAGYNYRKGRDFVFIARANIQRAKLVSEETFPQQNTLDRTFYSVLPFVMFRFNFDRRENLRIFYRSNTQSPSVEQLQNVVDNSNPLQLSLGNPDLGQAISHRLFIRYSKTNTDKASVFYFMLGGSYTNNYIGNSTFLSENDNPVFASFKLDPGAQLSMPVNLDGYWNIRSYLTYGFPIKVIKSNLNLDATASYIRTPGLLDDLLNISQNKTLGLGVTLSSNISENLDFTLATRSNFNDTGNSLDTDLNEQYLNQNSRLRLGWILPKGIVFRSNIVHQLYTGLSDDFNDSYFLWTLGIGKKIFKNQRGEITLSVVDLLRQNTSLSRNITSTYIEDVRNTVLQRYAMLSFTYNFRNFSTSKQRTIDEEREKKRRERRGWW